MDMIASTAERTAPSFASLQPRPDQLERWLAHDKPVPFDVAAQRILDAHREDGEAADVVVQQLRTWCFVGAADGKTMALARVPFDGRPDGDPLALRATAFNQLCTKLGAPPQYIRTLPVRLQIATMNWALVRAQTPALLRLAGSEIKAVVSDSYAAQRQHTSPYSLISQNM